MQYDNTNTGILARNDRRERDSQPEYTGSINIGGVEYWLNAWVNVGKDGGKLAGQKYFKLLVAPKDGLAAPRQAPKQQQVTETFSDDEIGDIPF